MLRWKYNNGFEVEIKHEQLGLRAPYAACQACPVRARCREGIHALRLTSAGVLQPCMDRPDLGLSVRCLATVPMAEAVACWQDYMEEL